ncbi:MAG: hypothetical protein HeimC2_04140 [Candidatus Heimdallarchaeota archaeon LC_2]|nr:MAG: hypothetical protein HeimC2_04140 [Candidatus Heimdallarchaeota archaeon LC_2]
MFRKKQKKFSGRESETLKSLKNTLDGYEGYDNVKDRTKSDRALRTYLLNLMLDLIDSFSMVKNQLMQGQLLSTWPASNQVLTMLNDLRTLLTSDVYRHSTFFETPNISDNIEISVLYLLESETILEIRSIKENISTVSKKLEALDLLNIENEIFKIKSDIEAVNTTISDRAELIASFEIVGF